MDTPTQTPPPKPVRKAGPNCALSTGSAARASAARMEDALRQIEDLVGRCVSNPGLENNVVEMVAKLADRHDALRELAIAAGDFVHNIEHQHVTGGAAVRDDGCYMRLRGMTTRAGFYSPNT